MSERKLRLGIAGLGRAFMLMAPTFSAHPRLEVVAAAAPDRASRERFTRDFAGRTYSSVDELCRDADVEAIYIATPHQLHAEHAQAAFRNGKHVLVEKPMAVSLAECAAMIDAAQRAGVKLVVGHSHSFDAPYQRARALIATGAFGAVRMIHALNYTDFLYRPRRPEELDTAQGGGVVFSQGAHQVDIVRLLGGGRVRSVRAQTGAWDAARPTEGAYSALLTFDDGAFASLSYSGYAHFDSDEFQEWMGEMGVPKDPSNHGAARGRLAALASPTDEAALKRARGYGGTGSPSRQTVAHNHFGVIIVSCDGADLRPTPTGVMVYDHTRRWLDAIPAPAVPRAEVIDELYEAVVRDVPAVHNGEWAMATLETCLAILQSARADSEVRLAHRCSVPR